MPNINRYYKDRNEGCTKKVTEKFKRCNGEEYCYTFEEPLPYIQDAEILAPLFFDITMSRYRNYKGCVEKSGVCKGRLFIHSRTPISAGMVLRFGRNGGEYLIVRRLKYLVKGNWVYYLKRTDGSEPVEGDLRVMAKKSKFQVVRKY